MRTFHFVGIDNEIVVLSLLIIPSMFGVLDGQNLLIGPLICSEITKLNYWIKIISLEKVDAQTSILGWSILTRILAWACVILINISYLVLWQIVITIGFWTKPSQYETNSPVSPKVVFLNMHSVLDLFKVIIDILRSKLILQLIILRSELIIFRSKLKFFITKQP